MTRQSEESPSGLDTAPRLALERTRLAYERTMMPRSATDVAAILTSVLGVFTLLAVVFSGWLKATARQLDLYRGDWAPLLENAITASPVVCQGKEN